MIFNLLKALNRVKRKNYFHSNSNILTSYSRYYCLSSKPWRIIFYGTDGLSEKTLKSLNFDRIKFSGQNIVKSLEVVCIDSDCAVRRYALENKLIVHTWPYNLPADTYDVGVVVSFGHLIPSKSILVCKYGIINGHPSVLPRWRGAAPIIHTILNDDRETGVTITQVSPNKFDVGNIILQNTYSVPEHCTAKILTEELGKIVADMVMITLADLTKYLEASYPQPGTGVTYARKIKPENCKINWPEDSVPMVDRKFRAYNGFFDVYTFWKDKKIVILGMASVKETEDANISSLVSDPVSPGYCYFHKKRKVLYVKCQDGWTGITSIRIPKRGEITALDFNNGFLSKEEPSKCVFT